VNVGVYIYELAEELDWAGPWEVLASWARAWPDDGVEAFTITDSTDPVRGANGLRVLGDHTWETAPSIDLLVVPGGNASAPAADEKLLERLRSINARGGLVTSVCTGAFVLQAAGLLEGKPASTHWGSVERLRELGVDVRDERFVDAGDVVTSAGVSAGIDMALHLVARLHSTERAREVRRYIQYDPEPPV
jgi:transcriptional regulator GlxA family with amidase domain